MSDDTKVTIQIPGEAPIETTAAGLKAAAESATAASGKAKKPARFSGTFTETSRTKLRAIAEKLTRLEDERAEVSDEIKAVMAEAKAVGFSPAMIRRARALLKVDKAGALGDQLELDLYVKALEA